MTDAFDLGRPEERALRSISLKTGALFRAGCVIGALCAGVRGEELELARRYGDRFGLAFQVLDDLLDLVSTTERLGKPVGNDLRQGTYTVPLLRALARPAELGWIRDALAGDGRQLSEAHVEKVLTALKQDEFVDETMEHVRALAEEASRVWVPGLPGPDTTVRPAPAPAGVRQLGGKPDQPLQVVAAGAPVTFRRSSRSPRRTAPATPPRCRRSGRARRGSRRR